MKLTLVSFLILATVSGACKNSSKENGKYSKSGAASEDANADAEDAAAEESVKSVLAADLTKALMNDAGLSQADADEIVSAGNSSMSLVSGSIASDAASFLAGVLGSLNNKTLKIADLGLVLRTIGSSVTSSVLALAGSQNELALGGVPDLAKPEVLEALKAVFGNGLARLPAADKIAYVYELIQGMMKAIQGSGEKLSSAQFTGIAGSLSSGILVAAGAGLSEAELPKLVSETARGMLAGSSLIKDFPVTGLGDLAQAVADGSMKGVGSLSSFKLSGIGGIAKATTGGLVKGAGAIPSLDPKALESLAKSTSSGLFSGAKTIPGFEPALLPEIGSASIGALIEEASKLSGYDKNNLAALAKAAANGLMTASGAMGKLDSAQVIAIAKSALEGLAGASSNLGLLSAVDLIPKIIAAIKEGLKEGAVNVPGFDPTQLDSIPSSLLDILAGLGK